VLLIPRLPGVNLHFPGSLGGPLRISAFSALKSYFNAEAAEIRREPQRKKIKKARLVVDTIDRFSYIKPALQPTRGQIKNLRKGCLDARLLLIVR